MKLSEYLQHDATSLAALVKSKQITPNELLGCAIAQMDKVNPQINAVVRIFVDEARHTIDHNLDLSSPFAGVPFLLKDFLAAYAGQEMNNGSKLFKGFIPQVDSELVKRYKKAGLVIFGKTNLPELGLAPYTESLLHGTTHNPWNLNYSAGGSSGGSAAAVAAGIIPAASAGDGGGSIRIPASLNGLVGLKPTRGRTPSGPQTPDGWFGMAVEHVITRTVRDCAAFLDISHGDYTGQLLKIPNYTDQYASVIQRTPKAMRVGLSTAGILGGTLDEDNIAAVNKTAKLLRELGHNVEEVSFNHVDGEEFVYQYALMLCADTAATLKTAAKTLGKKVTSTDVEPRTWSLALIGQRLSADQIVQAQWYFQQFSRDWNTRYDAYDVMITSTMAQAPALIGQHAKLPNENLQHAAVRLLPFLAKLGSRRDMILKTFGSIIEYMPQTMLANVTGQPAISMPIHMNEAGLPIGVMATGRYGDEATILQLAQQLEMRVQWHKLRPTIATMG
jgi:amidase